MSVQACQAAISSREFTAWMAFARLHPFGVERDEQRHAEVMALLANVNRDPKKRPQPYTRDDFMAGDRTAAMGGRSAARQLRGNAAAAGRLKLRLPD